MNKTIKTIIGAMLFAIGSMMVKSNNFSSELSYWIGVVIATGTALIHIVD